MRSARLVALILAATGCSSKETAPRQALVPGEYHLAVPGGNIWYKISGSGNRMPVVLVHGGPGLSSFYLKPLEALADERPVIRYDQLGGGKSDRITDMAMFTFAHFVNELDSLRSSLGIPKWHLVGHSWGTMLGLEYYRAHPDRVASLTLAGPVFDVPAYQRQVRELLKTLPDSLQRAVARAEATHRFETPGYQQAMDAFYARYVFRRPVQADLDSTFATINQDIYNYMQGPSEFTVTGTLKDWDATGFLPRIKVPTLLTVGEFDEVGPELARGYARRIPGARFEQLAGAAHITTWDAPDRMTAVVRSFLRSADSTHAP